MRQSKKPVTVVIVGAGGRGTNYALFASAHPDRLRVVGVAEPRDFYRNNLVKTHNIPRENVFTDWHDMADRPCLADAVIIATQDAMHADPAIAFAVRGYAMLLEKPMAPTPGECRRIVFAVKKHDILFAVCHVLRYTWFTQELKRLITAGAVGDIVSIQHLEPVGYWHQAHSFVRGNWRNEKESSPMLLAKSCHDLDWIRYMVGDKCRAVSSFGTTRHFKKSEKPKSAGNVRYCLECLYEPQCPYSAKKIYITDRFATGYTGWPVDIVTPQPTAEGLSRALAGGPYGRCVYECDNDVVDNQVVNMEFAHGQTASFTMTGFNKCAHRKTRIFGTRGEINGDGKKIELFDFLTDKDSVIAIEAGDPTLLGGHGGGDYALMDSFVAAVAEHDRSKILSGPDESLETHLMVFAAEKARLEQKVVTL